MGHALAQSAEWYTMYRQEGFIDGKISRTGGLQKALSEVYAVQNSLANLHLLDEGINRSKRHVFTKAVKEMYAAKRDGGFDLGHELEARCVKYFGEHDIDVSAGHVASSLLKTFRAAEGPITKQLTRNDARPTWDASGARDQEKRMLGLGESVVQVYEDLGC
jgi:hypothetical protein